MWKQLELLQLSGLGRREGSQGSAREEKIVTGPRRAAWERRHPTSLGRTFRGKEL